MMLKEARVSFLDLLRLVACLMVVALQPRFLILRKWSMRGALYERLLRRLCTTRGVNCLRSTAPLCIMKMSLKPSIALTVENHLANEK